jgi:hypothetical protein
MSFESILGKPMDVQSRGELHAQWDFRIVMALVGRGRKRFSAVSIRVLIGPPSSWGWLLVEMLSKSLAFLPLDRPRSIRRDFIGW